MDVSNHHHTPTTSPLGKVAAPHYWSGCFGEGKNFLPLLALKPQVLSRLACRLLTIHDYVTVGPRLVPYAHQI